MTGTPDRTDWLIGALNAGALAAAYQCGHCSSETSHTTDDNGIVHVAVRHDDTCPVLAGALSSTPDVVRALASHIPDTFRR
ncbi:hypothetical protein AB0N17_03565 [Streptomyces sp. NPDC051133]|uniref:hypothetical protein n=1 Tax=Streptomyces sp. NPDC051133 TaxID=3155521 RepID=UPI00341F63B6